MSDSALAALGLVMAWTGITSLALVVLYVAADKWRKRRALARPAWPRVLAEQAYFRQTLTALFEKRGYRVQQVWGVLDPIERQERELVIALTRRGVPHAALCGRWIIPITSEIVSRFEQALQTTNARQGLIITTSHFTDAARQKAAGYSVELVDGEALQAWIAEAW